MKHPGRHGRFARKVRFACRLPGLTTSTNWPGFPRPGTGWLAMFPFAAASGCFPGGGTTGRRSPRASGKSNCSPSACTIRANSSDWLPGFSIARTARGRVVRFLGSGEVCSDYLTVLASPGRAGGRGRRAGRLALAAPHRPTEPIAGTCWPWPASNGAIRRSAASWLELYAARASIYRAAGRQHLADRSAGHLAANTWSGSPSRTASRFAGSSGGCSTPGKSILRTATDPAEMREAWQHLTSLHQRRMQSLGQCGCFYSPTFTAFHRDATSRPVSRRLAAAALARAAGRAIAAEYHLVGGRTLYVYQGGIDPDLLREEPGRLATIATLRQALAEGFGGFDFCRGDEGYKAHWRADRSRNGRLAHRRQSLGSSFAARRVGRASQRARLGPAAARRLVAAQRRLNAELRNLSQRRPAVFSRRTIYR